MDESQARTDAMGQLLLPSQGALPSLDGLGPWFNSPPLDLKQLKGKVVLIDFWTYSCINCLRSIPHVKAWWEKYRGDGLVVIGVHAPEFAFEREPANVAQAIKDLGITYPVALDNRVQPVERAQEQLLARALLRRCPGPCPLQSPWRRRI